MCHEKIHPNEEFLEKHYHRDFVFSEETQDILHIREAGLLLKDPEYTSSGKLLKYNLFEYIMEGEGYISFNGTQYRVSKGDFIIIKKRINSENQLLYGSNKENPYLKTWFTANGSYIDGMFTAFNITEPITIVHCSSLREFQSFVISFKNNRYDQLASMSHILSIMYRVFQSPEDPSKATTSFDDLVDAYLEQNIRNRTTIKQAAETIGVSPRHFAEYFKNRFKSTYGEYTYQQRLQFSKTLLQNNKYTITEIADYLGFCDQSYFSNCFYKEFGMYPTDYRKKVAQITEAK